MSVMPKIIQPQKSHPFKNRMTVIFKQREGRADFKPEWAYEDGTINFIDEENKRVDMLWLEGYRSRNDTVPFEDIVAIVDLSINDIVKIGPFRGHFKVLHKEIEPEPAWRG